MHGGSTVRRAVCCRRPMPVGARFSCLGWFSAFVARLACATFAQRVVGFRFSFGDSTRFLAANTNNPRPKTSAHAQWPSGSRGCYGQQSRAEQYWHGSHHPIPAPVQALLPCVCHRERRTRRSRSRARSLRDAAWDSRTSHGPLAQRGRTRPRPRPCRS